MGLFTFSDCEHQRKSNVTIVIAVSGGMSDQHFSSQTPTWIRTCALQVRLWHSTRWSLKPVRRVFGILLAFGHLTCGIKLYDISYSMRNTLKDLIICFINAMFIWIN